MIGSRKAAFVCLAANWASSGPKHIPVVPRSGGLIRHKRWVHRSMTMKGCLDHCMFAERPVQSIETGRGQSRGAL